MNLNEFAYIIEYFLRHISHQTEPNTLPWLVWSSITFEKQGRKTSSDIHNHTSDTTARIQFSLWKFIYSRPVSFAGHVQNVISHRSERSYVKHAVRMKSLRVSSRQSITDRCDARVVSAWGSGTRAVFSHEKIELKMNTANTTLISRKCIAGSWYLLSLEVPPRHSEREICFICVVRTEPLFELNTRLLFYLSHARRLFFPR